jgi:septum formation protein
MFQTLILASGSSIRAQLLQQANIPHQVSIARIDEEMIKAALLSESAPPRDIADTLAEMKARRVSDKNPGALVLGCDQVLDHRGTLLSKPITPEDAISQLTSLRGDRHSLLSAAVIVEDGRPIWRHVGQVRLRMRDASDAYIAEYVDRNWDSIQHAVGSYKLEEEGVRLFSGIEGDYFNVLGLPLIELINYLTIRGDLPA